jgi:hypothetical protein
MKRAAASKDKMPKVQKGVSEITITRVLKQREHQDQGT